MFNTKYLKKAVYQSSNPGGIFPLFDITQTNIYHIYVTDLYHLDALYSNASVCFLLNTRWQYTRTTATASDACEVQKVAVVTLTPVKFQKGTLNRRTEILTKNNFSRMCLL